MNDKNYVNQQIKIDGFISVYYFENNKEFWHKPESHNFWEIVYIDKGRAVAITDGIGTALPEGYAIFHEPNDVHAHISDRKVSNNMFVVSFFTQSPAMEYFQKKTFRLDDTAKDLLTRFLSEAKLAFGQVQGDYKNVQPLTFENEEFGAGQLMAAYLEAFLIHLIRLGDSAGTKITQTETSRRLAKNSTSQLVAEYLKQNVYGTLSLDRLCAKFYLSKSQLFSLFREFTNDSPIKFYNTLKVKEAQRLLKESEHSISEIAEMLSYSSIHRFSRAFKNECGVSPTKYKKALQTGNNEPFSPKK